jgi:hypothetical protein
LNGRGREPDHAADTNADGDASAGHDSIANAAGIADADCESRVAPLAWRVP